MPPPPNLAPCADDLASIPTIDRDEARYAQATRQMLESSDFLHIRFQDEARNKKPAGIYWLQAASVALTSDATSNAIWPYRLPSVIGALVAIAVTRGARNLLARPMTAFCSWITVGTRRNVAARSGGSVG